MAEKLVTCNECQGMFDVGHIPPGREMKCPSCGTPLVVPGEEPQPIPVASRPRTAVAGSSPRQATASGSRIGTAMKRNTPLMRRATHARGGTVVRGPHGEEQPLSNSRHGVAVQKKGFPVVLVVSLVGLVVVGIFVAMAMSGQNAEKLKAAEKAKKPGSAETAAPASGTAVKPGVPPAGAGGGRQVSVAGSAPAAAPGGTTESGTAAPKNPPTFQEGSDGSVDGWSVNAAEVIELEKKLLASWEKKGDPEIRKEILLKSDVYFPLIADRLRSDKEGVAKEAATIANTMFKKHDIRVGKEGAEFVPDITMCNDQSKRTVLFREMREAWEKASDRIRKDVAGGGSSTGGDVGPVTSSSVVDALRRGGQDRDDMMAKMKSQPGYYVRELIKQLDSVGEDVLAGRAVCRALNDLTSANIPVPTAGEFNAADQKKKWDEWLLGNLDKLK